MAGANFVLHPLGQVGSGLGRRLAPFQDRPAFVGTTGLMVREPEDAFRLVCTLLMRHQTRGSSARTSQRGRETSGPATNRSGSGARRGYHN